MGNLLQGRYYHANPQLQSLSTGFSISDALEQEGGMSKYGALPPLPFIAHFYILQLKN